MAVKTDSNVAGYYDGTATDSIDIKLHGNEGYEVFFNVWEDSDGIYHVFADTDDSTEDFLEEYYPDELENYRKTVESIPTESSRYISIINQFIAHQTYNSIRPLIEDERFLLAYDEEELDRD